MPELKSVSKQQGKLMRALGLMSGTSLDGIDVALIETDGALELKRGHAATYPYSEAFRAKLREGLAEARSLTDRTARPGTLRILEQYLTELHAEAVSHYIQDHGIEPGSIDVIGFHGQTVLHRPEARLTVQLGDAAALAHKTGTDVVYDLRAADVAAGGEGAPLVPAYHAALVGKLPGPTAFVNIGGVANVTWVPDGADIDRSLMAFDTGPGNALIDDWMQARAGKPFDAEGECAASGTVDEAALAALLAHPYFAAPPPKSLDRNAFAVDSALAGLSLADGAATLTAFTAASIAKSRYLVPAPPRTWVVSGGGRRNKTLMSLLAERVEGPVIPAEVLSLDGDAIEAEAWAYLAVRSVKGLPITFPGTTGVAQPMTGGVLVKAPRV